MKGKTKAMWKPNSNSKLSDSEPTPPKKTNCIEIVKRRYQCAKAICQILVVVICVANSGANAAQGGRSLLMQIEERKNLFISGESTFLGHKGWIDVASGGHAIDLFGDGGSTIASRGVPVPTDLTIRKRTDLASLRLADAMFSGKEFMKLTLREVRQLPDTPVLRPISLELQGVSVTRFRQVAADPNELPMEEVCFEFKRLQIIYNQYQGGKIVEEVTADLDALLGTSDPALDTDKDGLSNDVDQDDDGDLMTDEFELATRLNPLVDDAKEDLDGDGRSNLDEFISGSHPGDPFSTFEIDRIEVDIQNPFELVLVFRIVPGRVYVVHGRYATRDTWFQASRFEIPPDSLEEEAEVHIALEPVDQLYRVQVLLPGVAPDEGDPVP